MVSWSCHRCLCSYKPATWLRQSSSPLQVTLCKEDIYVYYWCPYLAWRAWLLRRCRMVPETPEARHWGELLVVWYCDDVLLPGWWGMLCLSIRYTWRKQWIRYLWHKQCVKEWQFNDRVFVRTRIVCRTELVPRLWLISVLLGYQRKAFKTLLVCACITSCYLSENRFRYYKKKQKDFEKTLTWTVQLDFGWN